MNLKMPIVFDNDCLCSFSWINRLDIIDRLFAGQIVVPKVVFDEIKQMLKYRSYRYVFLNIDQKVKNRQYEIKEIPALTQFESEYFQLTNPNRKDSIGKGEAAAIVIAKMLSGTLASNNLKDVLLHIQPNHPPLITTETILYLAFVQKIITFQEGQQILIAMKQKNRKLSTYDFSELIKKWENM